MKVTAVKYMLMAQNMDRAVEFYTSVFSFTLSFKSEFWTEMTFGDAIIALHGGGDGSLNKTGLSIQTDNIEEFHNNCIDKGATENKAPESRPGEPIVLSEIIDPEGNIISLTEYKG